MPGFSPVASLPVASLPNAISTSAVGTATGSGGASAISANLALSVGSAVGAGVATSIGISGKPAVGIASGAGVVSGVGIYSVLSVGRAAGRGIASGVSASSAAFSSGRGRAQAIGFMVGRSLPFDIDRAWAVDINGSIIDTVQYDPITHTLRVIYVVLLVVDVGNMPMSITNTIQSSPDPQASTLAIVAAAGN